MTLKEFLTKLTTELRAAIEAVQEDNLTESADDLLASIDERLATLQAEIQTLEGVQ